MNTTEGFREVDTSRCCHGDCRQGRECPDRFIRQEAVLTAIGWFLLVCAFCAAAAFTVGYWIGA